MVGESGAGIWVDDEIASSGNPHAHALDTVANAMGHGFRWICMRSSPEHQIAFGYLLEACKATGWQVEPGTWDQNLDPQASYNLVSAWGSRFHIINVETRDQERKWTDGWLDNFRGLKLPGGLGVIWTEPAWVEATDALLPDDQKIARWQTRTSRWRMRGFISFPEANEPENAPATIDNMMFRSHQFGWPLVGTCPVLYFIHDYSASNYTDQINSTQGRFSVYRLGDIGNDDWSIMATWPRVSPVVPPPIIPPPVTAPTSEATRAAIEKLLTLPIEGGGLKTADANALVVAVADSWERRQVQAGSTTNPKQRLMTNRRIAKTTNAQWDAVDDNIKALLDGVNAS